MHTSHDHLEAALQTLIGSGTPQVIELGAALMALSGFILAATTLRQVHANS